MNTLFKWAGSKARLLDVYGRDFHPDKKFDTFVDLFCGGCSVALYMRDRYPSIRVIINDANKELIYAYNILRNNNIGVIKEFNKLAQTLIYLSYEDRRKRHQEIKEIYCFEYRNKSPEYISASLIILLMTGFNGMWKSYPKYKYRYSTPAGSMTFRPKFFDPQKLVYFSEFLQTCEIFADTYNNCPYSYNSYIYADPPYLNAVVDYANGFGEKEQEKLIEYLISTKCLFSFSNKEDGTFFYDLGMKHSLDVKYYELRHIASCVGSKRQYVKEVLLRNFG